jgi:hypothetical protein
MIITPAQFEDEMKKKTTLEEAVALMADTLDSLGYAAGLKTFFNCTEMTADDNSGNC